jgi:hypothetical protein
VRRAWDGGGREGGEEGEAVGFDVEQAAVDAALLLPLREDGQGEPVVLVGQGRNDAGEQEGAAVVLFDHALVVGDDEGDLLEEAGQGEGEVHGRLGCAAGGSDGRGKEGGDEVGVGGQTAVGVLDQREELEVAREGGFVSRLGGGRKFGQEAL